MKRDQVAVQYTWNLADIFSSEAEWEALLSEVKKEIDFSEFKGKLGEKEIFLSCMKKQDDVSLKLEKLYVYAMMKRDSDTADSAADALIMRAQSVLVELNANLSFLLPELTHLEESVLIAYRDDPDFADYDYFLTTVIKSKKHVLSPAEENLLAMGGEVYSQFQNAFMKLNNADIRFPVIKNREGEKIQLTHGVYSVVMNGTDRALRKKAFEGMYGAYASLLNTITAIYAGNVRKNVFIARARKYDSCLAMALSNEDVDPVVYQNLIKAVHKTLPAMHRYIAAKKRALGLSRMYMYDMYVPVVENVDLKLEYEDAFRLVKEGLQPLGDDYVALLQRAFDERWIDVMETDNKRSGAYSTAVYDVHPYVLLNYQKTTHDVFTIAHELGHSLHSYFSNHAQHYAKADYKIFVAEVASTVNEVLLLKHILGKAEDKKLKKYLLSYFLEMIRTTLFRQTQFAEFEFIAHTMAENGEPLTKEKLSSEYLELNKKYYGKSVVSNEEISYEWARIPHFYNAFYVYKYATGIISAMAIVDRILKEGAPAVKDYFAFLSSGSSDNPVNLLKIAGVDLTKTAAFDNAMNVFKDTLAEFEAI
jgi:oligoendopeptidase F